MDGVITRQSEEYIMMMRMLKKCSKEILEFQDLPVPIAGEVYIISRKTKCSTFAKHFVPKSHLLTQFKM